VPGYAAGLFDEPSSVVDAFDVECENFGVRVGRHRGKHISFTHVNLIPKTHQMRDSKTLTACPIDHRLADRAGVRDESHIARCGRGRRQECCIKRQMRIKEADAVRAHEAHLVSFGNRQTGCFQRRTFRANFAESS
jgi:hypothetical protein